MERGRDSGVSLWQNGPNMRNMRRALPLAALSLVAAVASAQDVPRADNYLGLSIGTYILTDGNTRDIFGSAPVTYGVQLVQPYRTASRGIRFDLTSFSLNSEGSSFFLVGGTVGYEVQALNQGGRPTAFARVGVGPAFYSYDINRAGTANDVDGRRISFIGSAEAGYTFADRFVLSARYLMTPELDGLNFSGLQFQLTYAAFKL